MIPSAGDRLDGWAGFVIWGVVGVLFSLSFLGAASIGLFVLPAALVSALLAGRAVRAWPEVIGVLEGAASLSLFVGMANLGSTPCPSRGSGSVQVGGRATGRVSSCGGLAPWPWLVAGLLLAVAGLAAYMVARLRS